MKLFLANRETGARIEPVKDVESGLALIEKHEKLDKIENCYKKNYYDIVDENYESQLLKGGLFMGPTERLKSIFEEAAKVSGKILENEENVRAYATALEIAEKKLERNKERLAILMSEADRIYRGKYGAYPRFTRQFDLEQVIEKRYPKEFFYTKKEAPEGDGCYTCVDNSLGQAWTKDFESAEDVFKFFFGDDVEDIRNGE